MKTQHYVFLGALVLFTAGLICLYSVQATRPEVERHYDIIKK